jgi:hypothetical protein
VIFTCLSEQVIEFAKRAGGKRAGGFKEYLEHARPVAPDKRISAPCNLVHTVLPVSGSLSGADQTPIRLTPRAK